MTLTELRYIVMLADEKHFGRAAERCHVSQPTLSVAVKKLEDELGLPLFERHKGNISVTDMGQRLVSQAQKILAEASIFKDLAKEGKHELNSPLKLGAIYSIGPYLFPHLLPQLKRSAPTMPLYIEENYTSVLRKKLKSCELDAIIVALPFEEPDIVTLPIYDEPFVVIVPKGHALCKEKHIDSVMLSQDNLLMLGPGHCFRDQVLDTNPTLKNLMNAARPSEQSGAPLMTEGSSLETIRHMVASGLGISVLPMSAVMAHHHANDDVEIRPFKSPVPFRTVALAWRVTFPRPKAIDMLKQSALSCKVLTTSDKSA